MKWVLLTLLAGANPFDAWERLPERVSYATSADAFGAWEQLGDREAVFAQWEELCRHKCGAECTCGDECECSAECECIVKAKTAKPSVKLSPEAQKKLEASRAKPRVALNFEKICCPCGPRCDCTDCNCECVDNAFAAEEDTRETLAVYTPPWCSEPCQWLKAQLGDGDEKTKLDWRKREAWFKPKSYPLVINMRTLRYWCQDPEKPDTRPRTMDQLRAILGTKKQHVSNGVPSQ